MKALILASCLFNIAISSQLSAMDYDQAIPLKAISQKPSLLKQKLIAFEDRLSIELSQMSWFLKKQLEPTIYISRLYTELPQIFESERTIEKFSRIQNSYFAETINKLITDYGYNHYNNVTGETLANIRNPEKDQPCPILNKLPLNLRRYIMQKAYNSIKKEFLCIILPKTFEIKDIHSKIGAVATINKMLKKFDVFNIKTKEVIFSIPNASDNSLMRFSTDGSILIVTTSLPQNAKTTYINLWNITTQKLLMSLSYFNEINSIFLKNKIMHVFEKTGHFYTAQIDTDNMRIQALSRINGGIQTINPPFTLQGEYYLGDNALLEKSFSYFLCEQAVKNTSSIIFLTKIYDTQFYKSNSLTEDQRKMIHKKIDAKIQELSQKNENPNQIMSWFG